ncbi:MAG TPA: hypothetical protein VFO86_02620 [Terriglobia bacterium]|nr:hypothetical protein [Terriglobia bacterium]
MKMMKALPTALLVGLMTTVLLGHHSVVKEFDEAKATAIQLTITKDGSKTAYGRKLTFAGGKSFDIHDRFFDPIPLSEPK